jgi:uncharacterized protein
MRVVFDAGVVFSGAGWRGEAYLCLLALARRRVLGFATAETIMELRRVADGFGFKARHSPHAILNWYYGAVKMVSPASLGKQRSRDVNDDPYLACALAARASFIVSRDEDLLVLGKPFGVEIITPRELLTRLAHGAQSRK